MSPQTCQRCGHSVWQHPDGGGCRLHPRGEQRCPCEAFAGPPTATSGNSPAGLQSILGGRRSGRSERHRERLLELAMEQADDRVERERRESSR